MRILANFSDYEHYKAQVNKHECTYQICLNRWGTIDVIGNQNAFDNNYFV
jgi:hypothetical protein